MKGGDILFMKIRKPLFLVLLLSLFLFIPMIAEAVPKITVDELNSVLGTEDLVVIDSRKTSDWKKSDEMIEGSFRGDPWKTEEWIPDYPKDKRYVIYCA